MNTDVLPTHSPALFAAAVERAAAWLRAGDVVALPTETVYGLAANALDAAAVAKIFQVKGRPAHNPIIVHVASLDMARACVAHWPVTAESCARAFWPGPLTLVLPRAAGLPGNVTAGGGTVGVRWPSHPFMQAVIRACGFPLAAPSANLSNQISPTTAEHVRRQLDGKIPLIVDGGPAQVGIESTVLDLSVTPPRLLRPGMISAAALAAIGVEARGAGHEARGGESVLRSPGMLAKHYAPKAKLIVLKWRDEADLRAQLANLNLPPAHTHILAHTVIPGGWDGAGVSVMPREAAALARALYAEWHRCDAAGARFIVVEAVPEEPAWSGIADRLKRAAT